jgi:hypothetical protein
VIAKELRRIARQATLEGRGAAALDAIKEMERRLRQAPADLGEPLYRLPALRMQIRSGIIRPLVIDFAICEDRLVVYLKGVKLLPQDAA